MDTTLQLLIFHGVGLPLRLPLSCSMPPPPPPPLPSHSDKFCLIWEKEQAPVGLLQNEWEVLIFYKSGKFSCLISERNGFPVGDKRNRTSDESLI